MQITRIHCNHPNYADYAVYLDDTRIWFCFVAEAGDPKGFVEVNELSDEYLIINGVNMGVKKLVLDKEGIPRKIKLFGRVRIVHV